MNYQLDVRNLLCPLPVIKVQSKVKQLQNGDTLEVICTDKTALKDIPTWCRIHHHTLLRVEQIQTEIKIVFKVNK